MNTWIKHKIIGLLRQVEGFEIFENLCVLFEIFESLCLAFETFEIFDFKNQYLKIL
jgi:hypothetical protein